MDKPGVFHRLSGVKRAEHQLAGLKLEWGYRPQLRVCSTAPSARVFLPAWRQA